MRLGIAAFILINVLAYSAVAEDSQPPAFPTEPIAVTGVVSQALTYTVPVTGSGAIALTASGLPPGLEVVGATVAGMPTAAGNFAVTITATNAFGTASKSFLFAIDLAGSSGTVPDADGDGFSDALELLFNSNPSDPFSNPTGSETVNVVPLSVKSLAISLGFTEKTLAKDSLKLTASVSLPATYTPAGKDVGLEVAGIAKKYTLDDKGTAANKEFKLAKRNKKSGLAQFTLSLKGNLKADLIDDGFTGTANAVTTNLDVPITVIINGQLWLATKTVAYANKKGTSGKAK